MWYKFSTSNMHRIMNPDYVGNQDYENLLSAFIKEYGTTKDIPERDPKGKSMWLLKDGSIIDMGQTYHMMAYKKLLSDHKLNPITEQHATKDIYDTSFTPNSFELYRNFGKGTGAIRIYHNGYPDGGAAIQCYISHPPTAEQLSVLKNIYTFQAGEYNDGSVFFEFKDYYTLEDELYSNNLLNLNTDIKNANETFNEAPMANQNNQKIKSFISNIDATDKNPIIPSLERKRLFENYPGDENAKLRSLYEKSASTKISQNNALIPPIHDNCRCYIDTLPGGRKIWQFSDNCCQKCKDLAFIFNRNQSEVFDNKPAIMPSPKPIGEISPIKPPTPYEQPATVPIVAPEDQITNEYLYPRRLFNRFRF